MNLPIWTRREILTSSTFSLFLSSSSFVHLPFVICFIADGSDAIVIRQEDAVFAR